jgi:hypothetical protein
LPLSYTRPETASSSARSTKQSRHRGRHPTQRESRGDRQRGRRRQRQGGRRTVEDRYTVSGQADSERDRHTPTSRPRRRR